MNMDYLCIITFWTLVLAVKVCDCQHSVVTPFKDQGGMEGHTVTLTTVLQKQSLNDWVAISYQPRHKAEILIWQEDQGDQGVAPEISVTSAVNKDTFLGVYNVTIQLLDVENTLVRLAVNYKAYFSSDNNTFTEAKLHIIAPISCHMTGDPIKQVDEQANLTCEMKTYGGSSTNIHWSTPWSHIPVYSTNITFDVNQVGHVQTVLNRRVSEVDDGQEYICDLEDFYGVSDSCKMSYSVRYCPVRFKNAEGEVKKAISSFSSSNQWHHYIKMVHVQINTCLNLQKGMDILILQTSPVFYNDEVQSWVIAIKSACNKMTHCIVHQFRSVAGKPGDSVILSTTVRKQAVNDWMAMGWTGADGQQSIIWQENDTSVILPDHVTVETSMDKSTLHSTYNITIQLPQKTQTLFPNNALINITGTYKAYMISYPGVKTTAKVAAIDDVSCSMIKGPELIAGQPATLTCSSDYQGPYKPKLSWFNESGHPVIQRSSNHQIGGGLFEVAIAPKASSINDGTVFQCRLRYSVTEFDYFPPLYQDTCNASFTVLYGTKCTMNGGPVKKSGDPVELTCTTKYDGVNIPEMDWYRHNSYSNKLTSRVEVNNVTREYKVYMSSTAGTKDESFQCRLRYNVTQWVETVKEDCMIAYKIKSSVESDGAIFTVTGNLVSVALILQTFLTLCSK